MSNPIKQNHQNHDACQTGGKPSCNAAGCGCGHSRESDSEKKGLLFIGIAALLFIASFFLQNMLTLMLTLLLACLIPGYEIFMEGLRGLVRLRFDENTLLVVAVTVAFLLGDYREAAAVTILFCLGEFLEELAVAKSKKEIAALSAIRSETANLQDGEGARVVPASSVAVGSIILVKPGERIPLDSVILEGSSQLNNAALTGESLPVDVAPGAEVLSAAINLTGILLCRTTAAFEDSTASKILRLAENAAATRGKTETLIARFAKIYTPIIMGLAVLLAVVPPLLQLGPWNVWIGRSLIFLVASCPCALVISIPLSFFAGIGACSKTGVLVKGTKYLELLSKAKFFVFDKTGTLTTGVMSVAEILPLKNQSEAELLRQAVLCTSNSNHPISKAVNDYAGIRSPAAVERLEELPGKGLLATAGGRKVAVGSRGWMKQLGIDLSGLPEANLYVAENGVLLGCIRLSDTPRPDAKETLSYIKSRGAKTVMLTGDSPEAARLVQEQAGLDEIHASLLPQDKLAKILELRAQGIAVFVGDGINDAPVLAGADAGVAMGMGSDAAIEAADIVLLSDRLGSLAQAVKLSARTLSIAKFNILFALSVKAIVLVLGAMGYAQMWTAVAADVGVSVLTVLNATRLLKTKKGHTNGTKNRTQTPKTPKPTL